MEGERGEKTRSSLATTLERLGNRPRLILALALLALACGAYLTALEAPLKTSAAPSGIVSLELAGSAQEVQAIFDSWHLADLQQPITPDATPRRDVALRSISIDFVFLVLYASALLTGYLAVAARTRAFDPSLGGRLASAITLLALLQPVAALCDVGEDLLLRALLLAGANNAIAGVATALATAKFLILFGSAALVVGASLVVRQRRGVPILQYLFFSRFAWLLGLVLVGLGPVAAGPASDLLRNLLYLEPHEFSMLSGLACICAWTVLLSLRNILEYGELRFVRERSDALGGVLEGMATTPADATSRVRAESIRTVHRWVVDRHVWLTALLVFPLLLTALIVSLSESEASGLARAVASILWSLLGVAGALALLVVAGTIQWWFGDDREPGHALLRGLPSHLPRAWRERRDRRLATRAQGQTAARIVRLVELLGPGYTGPAPHRRVRSGHVVAFWLFVVVFVFYALGGFLLRPDRFGNAFPEICFLLLIVLAFTWLLPGVSFFADRYRIPVVLLLLLWSISGANLRSGDHFFPVSPDPEMATSMPSVDQTLRDSGEDPLVVVTASGGGIRAAAWTAVVLGALEQDLCSSATRPEACFRENLGFLSSVSGGSVGLMFYLDHLQDQSKPGTTVANAGRSALFGSAWGFAYPDLGRGFSPVRYWRRDIDRGWALAEVWRGILDEQGEHGATRLSSWTRAVAKGQLPPFAFNATVVETGAPFLIAPFSVRCRTGRLEQACPGERDRLWQAANFVDELPGLDLEVATGARLSASFPWVSPVARAGLLDPERTVLGPVDQRLPLARERFPLQSHLADGGYYDNFGIDTALSWLQTQLDTENGLQNLKRRGVVFVIINAFTDRERAAQRLRGTSETHIRYKAQASGWVASALGPLQTILAVRTSSQLNRNRFELSLLRSDRFHDGVRIEPFVFDLEDPTAPLSWKLTERERRSIAEGWDEPQNVHELNRLRACFSDIEACPAGDHWPALPGPEAEAETEDAARASARPAP